MRTIYIIVLCSIIFPSCSSGLPDFLSAKTGYSVIFDNLKYNKESAEFLYTQMLSKVTDASLVKKDDNASIYFKLRVNVNPSYSNDFEVKIANDGLNLYAKNSHTMKWLIMQSIKVLSKYDKRIQADDYPPAVLTLSDTIGNFPFEYRDVYLLENTDPKYSEKMCLNNVNYDWGIWGHNLGKILKGRVLSDDAFAKVDDVIDYDQFCFSSSDLYHTIERYIVDNYGEGTENSHGRFCIFPNDNDAVCMCERCKLLGNTSKTATPAVTSMILRLSKRFPHHLFFTSSYLSTKLPPKEKLPKNVGVIISAMEFPLQADNDRVNRKITDRVEQFQQVTDRVYIWDYISNFDDYLTPFPILKIMQLRLQLYADLGVKGCFLNGAGEHYSSFSDIQSYVLGSLLINPYYSIDNMLKNYFKQYYPTSFPILLSMYLDMENLSFQRKNQKEKYGSIENARKSYLNQSSFVSYYEKLRGISNKISGAESASLKKLITALSFTRLEIARINMEEDLGAYSRRGNKFVLRPFVLSTLNQLSQHVRYPEMVEFSESGGRIENYIKDWRKYDSFDKPFNYLFQQAPEALSALDEDYQDLSPLTDGFHGLPSSYHFGWVISSQGESWNLQFELDDDQKNMKSFDISFLQNLKWRLRIPQAVELYRDNVLYKRITTPKYNDDFEGVAHVVAPVDLKQCNVFSLHIIRSVLKKNNIACDEIVLKN